MADEQVTDMTSLPRDAEGETGHSSVSPRSSLKSASLDFAHDTHGPTSDSESPIDGIKGNKRNPTRPYQKELARRVLMRTFSTEAPPPEVDVNGLSTNYETTDGVEKVDDNGDEDEEANACCIARYNIPPKDASRIQKLHYAFMCPPHGRVVKSLTLVLIGFMFWATFWSILGDQALPGGNFFGIAWVWIMSAIFGFLAENVRLPRLLGTLVGGILSSNVPGIDFGRDVDKEWSFALRKLAIVVVLIRAGLGMDLRALWRYKYLVTRMGTVPMAAEGCAVAIATRYLFDMPWKWAFLTGYTIAPMSAAATIPFMIGFHNSGLGIDKGVPTIVKLGAVLDNVVGLCVFSTISGVVFTDGDVLLTVLQLFPLQIVVGLVGGIVIGCVLWYIPHNESKNKLVYRFVFLLGGCIIGTFASGWAKFSSAGPLANVVIAIVAVYKWKKQGWTRTKNPLIPIFSLMWVATQLMLSGLIGALVDIRNTNWKTVGLGIGVLLIGMACRLLAQFLVAQKSHLNTREKLFVTIAWLPKATIQAAIGSVALDSANKYKLPKEDIDKGQNILTLSIMAIVLWVSVGALCIVHLGPILLNKTTPKKAQPDRQSKRDAWVQTSSALWQTDTDLRRLASVESYYGHGPPLARINSVLSETDPITIEMGHLVHNYL